MNSRILPIIFIIFISILILAFFNNTKVSSLPNALVSLKTRLNRKTNATSNFQCLIKGDKWIVVTSIFYPTLAINKFITLKTPWNLIVIGDRKTPKDWLTNRRINTSRLWFLSIDDQKSLDLKILKYLPEGSYARKNIGYLVAIKCGAQIVFESDDDNILDTDDIAVLPKIAQPTQIPWIGVRRKRSPFVNIYGSFGQPRVWPRGFPIDELKNVTEDGWHSVRKNQNVQTNAYIQQYLADLDPDVDALYRLAYPWNVGHIKFDRKQPPIALEPFTFSPYNTQNTVTYYEAFWGLLLPVTTSFRVCDIWRGLWVQRLLWDIGGQLVFGTATVQQVRNSHSYIADLDDEYQLYHQSGAFARFLTQWSSSLPSLQERIVQLARDIAEEKFWNKDEVSIIQAWISDLRSVGYSFPSIIDPPASSIPITRKQAAICVTGIMECIQEGWSKAESQLHQLFPEDIDSFLFLSSSLSGNSPVSSHDRSIQARSYMKPTMTVLYEDQPIDPNIGQACQVFFNPGMALSKLPSYHQQLWALSECYDLVQEYQNKMNVRYDLLIRARPDYLLQKIPSTLQPLNASSIIIPDENHFGGLNDRFAVGSMASMEKYMRRWHYLKDCYTRNIHAENFLKSTLHHFSISPQLMKNVSLFSIPHGPKECH